MPSPARARKHSGPQSQLNTWLGTYASETPGVESFVNSTVRLDLDNEPQPDLVLAKPRADYYASKHPTGEDTFLVLEVADTALRKDRKVKLPIYARLGVPEVWIEDLKHDLILVFRDRADTGYKKSLTFRRGDSLSAAAFPEITFKVEDLLG